MYNNYIMSDDEDTNRGMRRGRDQSRRNDRSSRQQEYERELQRQARQADLERERREQQNRERREQESRERHERNAIVSFEEDSDGNPIARTSSGNYSSQSNSFRAQRERMRELYPNARMVNPQLRATAPYFNGQRQTDSDWPSRGEVDHRVAPEYQALYGNTSYYQTPEERARAKYEYAQEKDREREREREMSSRESSSEDYQCQGNGNKDCNIMGGKIYKRSKRRRSRQKKNLKNKKSRRNRKK